MPKYELYKPRRGYNSKTTYDQSKQITRLENKINEYNNINSDIDVSKIKQ